MVAPEREPLKTEVEVEVDEFCLELEEEGLKGSRQRGKKDRDRGSWCGLRSPLAPDAPIASRGTPRDHRRWARLFSATWRAAPLGSHLFERSLPGPQTRATELLRVDHT
jgi:hypothetical protein